MKNLRKMAVRSLYAGAAVIAFGASPALAVDVNTENTTGVQTGVNTNLDSGVTLGTGSRVNGGIRTGSNTADTRVRTDVDSSATTRADIDNDGIFDDEDDDIVSTSNTTGVQTGTSTMLNSGVTVEDGARVNGGIRTDANEAKTRVKTNIDSDADTRVSTNGAIRTDDNVRVGVRTDGRPLSPGESDEDHGNWDNGRGKKLGHLKD